MGTISKLKDLQPDPKNANRGTERGGAMLEESLRNYGAGRSLLVDKNGVVIAGNKTLEAAVSVGLDDVVVVPTDGTKLVVVQRTDLDLSADPRAKALGVADNRVAQIGLEWDANVLQELVVDGADLGAMFTDKELAELVSTQFKAKDGLTDPDEVPDAPVDPITKPGDLWVLGDHRLLCGDSTNQMDIDRLADGASFDAVITDPPYGTGIIASGGLGNSKVAMNLIGDHDASLAKRAFCQWNPMADVQVWWGANYYSDVLPGSSSWAVWDKDHHGMTFADAELAYVSNGGPVRLFRHAWSGNHRASEKNIERKHPTQKPIALYAWIFETWAKSAQVIADPFLGSGTTLIAAEQWGRKCYGIEISPQYCDVIVQRWEAFTGKKAERVTASAGN